MEEDLIYQTKKIILARYPRFGNEIAKSSIIYNSHLKYKTAATDGTNIFVDPDYFASLSEDERLFLIAHEILHIKFEHMFRMRAKDGQMKNSLLWNIATDAIINANLERDGFKIKEGYVNKPEALQYTAEQFYEKLLKEKQENDKQKQEHQEKQQNNQNSQSNEQKDKNTNQDGQKSDQEQQNDKGGQDQEQSDDHTMWEESFEKKERGEGKPKKQDKPENTQEQEFDDDALVSDEDDSPDQEEYNENEEFDKNREERKKIAREHFNKLREQASQNPEDNISFEGGVGTAQQKIDWKLLVRREVEKTETIWSQRRSIAENNYAYRLEENDVDDEAETEVMIDVSGSVSIEMVKSFLRQLKPLLKESKLRVGCFNASFWGFVEIKSERDIDNFTIPKNARFSSSAWTEDWDLAVRSFTKKKEVNKIVFTDGIPGPGTMPKQDLKGQNVIWIVYKNKNFRPCCGKVIMVKEREILKTNVIKDKNFDL